MFAVVEINGFQYKVKEDDVIRITKLEGPQEGDKLEFDKVLFIKEDSNTIFGKPYIEGAKIVCHKKGDIRGKKIEVMKFKRRKDYKRIKGYRDDFSLIQIEKIIRP